jgi:drug/metabolite transporter (DMT)-like permease
MRASDIFRLVLLAAIWGGSFVFLRVVAPALGPIVTADLRVLIAWAALTIYVQAVGIEVHWQRFWTQYLVIGAFNACRSSPPAYPGSTRRSNATCPHALFADLLGENQLKVWDSIESPAWSCHRYGRRGNSAVTAMAGALLASVSYGFVSVYTKTFAAGNPAIAAAADGGFYVVRRCAVAWAAELSSREHLLLALSSSGVAFCCIID